MEALLPKNINYERVLKYVLGENNKELIYPLIDKIKVAVFETATPKVTYQIFNDIPSELIYGEDIKKHLSGCYGLVLFCVTIGNSIDTLIRKSKYVDTLYELVTDAVCSVLVEQVCEEFEENLKSQLLNDNIYSTSSYAGGYGDYPISVLPLQLKLLDAHRKIGVAVNENGLMIPRKSICAVIGISKNQVNGFRAGCENCKMRFECKLKKEGKTCVR